MLHLFKLAGYPDRNLRLNHTAFLTATLRCNGANAYYGCLHELTAFKTFFFDRHHTRDRSISVVDFGCRVVALYMSNGSRGT